MHKSLVLLGLLTLTACSSPTVQPAPVQTLRHKTATPVSTARTGFSVALAELAKVDPQARLYEIDVWQEAAGRNVQYGFLRSDASGNTFRVQIDLDSQQIGVENGFKGQASPVDVNYWKLDNTQVYAIAQANGLQDVTYLATLWEDTWHISGLKQDLYFQIDSQSGQIKLRCTGPYNDNCTDGDGSPLKVVPNAGMTAHLNLRRSRR